MKLEVLFFTLPIVAAGGNFFIPSRGHNVSLTNLFFSVLELLLVMYVILFNPISIFGTRDLSFIMMLYILLISSSFLGLNRKALATLQLLTFVNIFIPLIKNGLISYTLWEINYLTTYAFLYKKNTWNRLSFFKLMQIFFLIFVLYLTSIDIHDLFLVTPSTDYVSLLLLALGTWPILGKTLLEDETPQNIAFLLMLNIVHFIFWTRLTLVTSTTSLSYLILIPTAIYLYQGLLLELGKRFFYMIYALLSFSIFIRCNLGTTSYYFFIKSLIILISLILLQLFWRKPKKHLISWPFPLILISTFAALSSTAKLIDQVVLLVFMIVLAIFHFSFTKRNEFKIKINLHLIIILLIFLALLWVKIDFLPFIYANELKWKNVLIFLIITAISYALMYYYNNKIPQSTKAKVSHKLTSFYLNVASLFLLKIKFDFSEKALNGCNATINYISKIFSKIKYVLTIFFKSLCKRTSKNFHLYKGYSYIMLWLALFLVFLAGRLIYE